ncbi:MAG: O-antigen ligase family protein [Proteobacteria bacterium]|nr:O-antigen ligase family protein [Pseudomonadota bacterium]
MDPAESEELEPRRSERRRRRRRRRREQEEVRSEPVDALSIARQLAGLVIFGIFFLFVMAAPLPMGANRDWAWSPLVVIIGAMVLLCATGLAGREALRVSPAESTPLLVLIVCFLFFMGWVLFQMSPLAPPSPAGKYYAEAAEILGQSVTQVPSLAVDASRDALLKCIGCAMVFLIARVLFREPLWARLMLMVFAASAIIVIVYAVYMSLATHSCYVGSFLKKAGSYMQNDRCLPSGTFVGSNNFGCFCGMALIAALSLLDEGRRWHRRSDQYEDDGDGESAASLIASWLSGPKIMIIALALFCLGGLLLSASRAGFAATVAGVILLLFLLMRGVSRRVSGGLTVLALVVGLGVIVLAGGTFLHKMATVASAGNLSRVEIWKSSIEAFRQSPWFGWGLGSYNDIYAVYQSLAVIVPNDKAHSTPLEFLVELGIPGALAVFAVCLIPWGYALVGALAPNRYRYLPAAAFAISAVAILHSLVDFSLQMPAIGFAVSALLGLGWAQTFKPEEVPERPFASED